MQTSLRSGRTLRRHREVVEVKPSITYKRLKKQPQVDEKKKKLELNDLPVEILIDILSRLPIITILGAVKYTCKLWKLLISDSMFLDSYMTENPGCLYTLEGDSNLYFAVNSINDKPVGMKLPGDLGNKDKYEYMVSCRGLMFYRDVEKCVYICNPIIGDVVKVPTQHCGTEITCGFGYAPLSKRYKLFKIFIVKHPNRDSWTWRFAAAIFTLGGGELWRDVDPTQLLTNVRWWNSSAEYCNGALYWKTTVPHNESTSKAQVISFDLETETFRLRRVLPVGINRTSPLYKKYLTVLGETIAYVICLPRGLQEVWTLVDEVEDIWVEKYRFFVPTCGVDVVHFTLSGLWLNKDMYGMEYSHIRKMGPGRADEITRKRFLSYNADSKTYIGLQLPYINGDGISLKLVISHVGSFVSPSKIVAAERKQSSLVTG